jgi:mannose-6-phosphate isomerase-like protein (cupin superfamily)
MNSRMSFPRGVAAVAILVGTSQLAPAQTITKASASVNEQRAQPLILEKNDGELRTRRVHTDKSSVPASQFLLKVSPKNNGSQHLVAGTEELLPNARISKHKHLIQDEILLIQSGMAHVWLGDTESDVHAGAMVFIPADTWISMKNTGTEPVNLVFIFSAPGFEETMRCNSVPAGEKPTPLTPEQRKECAHLGHAVSASEQE